MTGQLTLAPTHSAVLSLDVQSGVVSVYVKDDGFVPRVARVLNLARGAGLRIIHVKVSFRPGVPEASPRNLFLSAVKSSPRHQQFFQGDSGAIHAALTLEPNDLIVTKTRVSAFAGTDLDLLLRANEIDTLVVMGIATSGVVLATCLHAFDVDYRIVVLKDCCADTDADLHELLTERLFPRIATVVSADEFAAALASSRLS